MTIIVGLQDLGLVALRKESVDRNAPQVVGVVLVKVALRKESVDRNADVVPVQYRGQGRSPQGERG